MSINNKKIQKDVLKQFAEMLVVTENELEKLLKQYDITQQKLEGLIFDIVKKYGVGDDSYLELKKYDRLSKLDKDISNTLQNLNKQETIIIANSLGNMYKEGYFRGIYALEKNLKAKIKFGLIRDETIETVINMPIEGLTFSERLYVNQFKLKQNVKSVLIDGILKGKDVKRMTKDLDERMQIGRNNASRIVRTESSRVWYESNKKVWKDSKVVDKVILIATLDGRTSSICQERDGNIYNVGKEPSLPFHPNCRSVYGAYFEDYPPSLRKDNQTKEYIPYKTYKEWKKDNL